MQAVILPAAFSAALVLPVPRHSDSAQEVSQKLGVGQGGGGVGTVQDGVDIVGVVLDLLGVELSSGYSVAAQGIYQDAGGHDQLRPPHQVEVGDGL